MSRKGTTNLLLIIFGGAASEKASHENVTVLLGQQGERKTIQSPGVGWGRGNQQGKKMIGKAIQTEKSTRVWHETRESY